MGCNSTNMQRLRNKSGQMALLMILLFAVALIFFAVSLNWGRIAQMKTQTLIGANSGAMASGSILASHAQSQWMQNIGGSTEKGRPGKCDHTSIWSAIVGIFLAIIAVILAPYTGGASLYLLVLAYTALAMSVINLALQVFVVQPGLTSLWNKLQRGLEPDALFLEQGITAGIGSVGTDTALLPDLFDMDTDGQFYGARGVGGKDEVGRYGFFYTERLKLLQPTPLEGVQTFLSQLQVFTNGDPSRKFDCNVVENLLSPCCLTGSQRPAYGCEWIVSDLPCDDPKDARCNSCCVPAYEQIPNPYRNRPAECRRLGIPNCNSPTIYKRIRSASCSPQTRLNVPIRGGYSNVPPSSGIPDECTAIDSNPYSSATEGIPSWPYVYDPYYQNYRNTADFSFLKFIGQDAVRGGTETGRVDYGIPETRPTQSMYAFDVPAGSAPIVRGDMFTMLWNMKDKLAVRPEDNTITQIGKVLDKVTPMTEFFIEKGVGAAAGPNECPQTDFFDATYTGTGAKKWWKPSMDGLCQGDAKDQPWPYTNNCDKVRFRLDGDGNPVEQICSQWHEDALDTLALEGKLFLKFAEDLTEMDRTTLEKSFTSWYPNAAQWIAPQCQTPTDPNNPNAVSEACRSNPNSIACSNTVCSTHEGLLRKWRRIAGGTDGTKGLYKVFKEWVEATPAGAYDAFCPAAPTPDMAPDELSLYTEPGNDGGPPTYLEKTARCLNYYTTASEKFNNCLTTPTRVSCSNLPRSLVANFPPNDLTNVSDANLADPNSQYMQNIKLSRDLAIANEDKIKKRAALVSDVVFKAVKARDEFKKAYRALDAFLGEQGKCDSFDSSSLQHPSCFASPAYTLMKARWNFNPQGGDINNFIIYGWKGPRTAKVVNADPNYREKQYWHMVRVEVKIPQRCPDTKAGRNNLCKASEIPKVTTETKGFLGTTRCYWLDHYDGRAMVRVTRWDEDRSSSNAVQFMNKVKLWGFTSNVNGKKALTENTVEKLQQVCAGASNEDVQQAPLGMTKETWDTISWLNLDGKVKAKFNNAFMINLLRGQGKVEDNKGNTKNNDANKNANTLAREKECLRVADDFLGRGISSTSCVNYYYDQKENRMAVKFEKCPDEAFKKTGTDYIDVKTP